MSPFRSILSIPLPARIRGAPKLQGDKKIVLDAMSKDLTFVRSLFAE